MRNATTNILLAVLLLGGCAASTVAEDATGDDRRSGPGEGDGDITLMDDDDGTGGGTGGSGTGGGGTGGDGTDGSGSGTEPCLEGSCDDRAVEVSAGNAHTCALTAGGELTCSGANADGQLGTGDRREVGEHVVVEGLGDAVGVSVGRDHSCALLGSGRITCWGDNRRGRLGTGYDDLARPELEDVIGVTDAVALDAGHWHSCALLADGTARCWGRNDHGQLGDRTLADRHEPVVVEGLHDVQDIATGEAHTCAVVGGQVRCWGDNDHGQLGDGTTAKSDAPRRVGGLSGVVQVTAGKAHTCALTGTGIVYCWGRNDRGQLGTGELGGVRATPVETLVPMDGLAISAGSGSTCALLLDGEVLCWGANEHGQLGDGTREDRATPLPVSGLPRATSITAGHGQDRSHACVTTEDGDVYCWGRNDHGQLGDGSTDTRSLPVCVYGSCG